MEINSITIDSTNSITELCTLGIKYPTDKSPYNKNPYLHKHAYTSIYNLLFSNIKFKNITLGEVGILENHSMFLWRNFFPNALLYGYEFYQDKIDKAKKDNIFNALYFKMNVKDSDSIKTNLARAYSFFDILIDDSTHEFDDQIKFINAAYKFLNPGGMLIIEDIFLSAKEEDYSKALAPLAEHFSSATFIEAKHKLAHSPGWDNDKLLVLYRNNN